MDMECLIAEELQTLYREIILQLQLCSVTATIAHHHLEQENIDYRILTRFRLYNELTRFLEKNNAETNIFTDYVIARANDAERIVNPRIQFQIDSQHSTPNNSELSRNDINSVYFTGKNLPLISELQEIRALWSVESAVQQTDKKISRDD